MPTRNRNDLPYRPAADTGGLWWFFGVLFGGCVLAVLLWLST